MAEPVSFATVDDLADWIGENIEPDGSDYRRANRILAAASNVVRAYTGRSWVDADGTVDKTAAPMLSDITVAVASRYYLNPTGETQWSKQIDDAMDGGSRKVDEAGLYLTASEKMQLDRLLDDTSPVIGGIATIGTCRGDAGSPDADDVWYRPRYADFLHATIRE